MFDDTNAYRVFLLRVWRAGGGGHWRASIEEPRTGRRYGFADLQSLAAFLNDQIDNPTTSFSYESQGDDPCNA